VPSAALVGLCHAYTAGAGAQHGNARTDPAFTALVTAAGGTGNVATFCATLLTTSPSHPAGAGASGHPTGQPTTTDGNSGVHPAAAPGAHSAGTPSHPGH